MKSEKSLIRKKVLENRSFLSSIELEEKSSAIMEKLINTKEFGSSKFIMCYMDFRNEVKTVDFIKRCLAMGKRVALPLVLNKPGTKSEMIACEVRNIESELERGTYGILEPKKDITRQASPEEIDLVVVPGVAFDTRRHRIGYGAGYYDRFLKKTRRECGKVGVAFELQIVDKVPAEEHDMQLDKLITESRIII